LYSCGLGRFLWPYLGDERHRTAVEIGERNADGLATRIELQAARDAASDAAGGSASHVAFLTADHAAWQGARMAIVFLDEVKDTSDAKGWSRSLHQFARESIACVFGNPFRPTTIDPGWLAWNNGAVEKLARTIYEDRRWEIMPILGDALEDALCDNRAILDHCRGPGPHVRGCWVVDLILGKT
jgi:hypothetical protein